MVVVDEQFGLRVNEIVEGEPAGALALADVGQFVDGPESAVQGADPSVADATDAQSGEDADSAARADDGALAQEPVAAGTEREPQG